MDAWLGRSLAAPNWHALVHEPSKVASCSLLNACSQELPVITLKQASRSPSEICSCRKGCWRIGMVGLGPTQRSCGGSCAKVRATTAKYGRRQRRLALQGKQAASNPAGPPHQLGFVTFRAQPGQQIFVAPAASSRQGERHRGGELLGTLALRDAAHSA